MDETTRYGIFVIIWMISLKVISTHIKDKEYAMITFAVINSLTLQIITQWPKV